MRNLLAFAAAAVIAFLGVGWYLGWYAVRPVKTDPGHTSHDCNEPSLRAWCRAKFVWAVAHETLPWLAMN